MQGSVQSVTVYLGIGANIGKREQFFSMAFRYLSFILCSMRIASYYESEPMYFTEQGKFLNTVVMGQCSKSIGHLLHIVQSIEIIMGRKRGGVRYGPRIIDIDILLYGMRVIRSPNLCVPHEKMRERAFVLCPLYELNPLLRDPKTKAYFYTYLNKDAHQRVKIYART